MAIEILRLKNLTTLYIRIEDNSCWLENFEYYSWIVIGWFKIANSMLTSLFSSDPAVTDATMIELLHLLPTAAPLMKHNFQQKMLLAAIDPR